MSIQPDQASVVLHVCLAVLAIIITAIFVYGAWNEWKLYQARIQGKTEKPIINLWHNETAPLNTSASKYLEMLG